MFSVGILTMSRAYNYGALLQAYALKVTLSRMGYKAAMINYSAPMQLEKYNGVFDKELSGRALLRNMLRLFYYPKLKRGFDRVDNFIRSELDGGDELLLDKTATAEKAAHFDAIIVGSDQMWNISLRDVTDVYFLDFDYAGKRITYAVSMGDKIEFPNDVSKKYLDLIREFARVSVREKTTQDFLSSHGIGSELVGDPVVLLTKNEWISLAHNDTMLPKGGYIFYYSVNTKLHTYQMAEKLRKHFGLPVVTCVLTLQTELHLRSRHCFDIGPFGFVDCINNASYVCTDSFHGTLFSIVLEKEFVSIFPKYGDNIVHLARRADLLKSVGLQERMLCADSSVLDLKKIDYRPVSEKLSAIRASSASYLQSLHQTLDGEHDNG